MRRFDSLAMALRAFNLVRIWEEQWTAFRRNAALVPMSRDRINRTARAADYLWRRVVRTEH